MLQPGLRLDRGVAAILTLIAALLAAFPAAAESKTPFPLYLGQPVEPIRGSTRIEGASARVELAPVLQGDVVHHDLVITNDGDAPIALRDVRACAGCILDGYARRIEPGRTGRISLVIVTDALGGQTVEGTVHARTDDPSRPTLDIDVTLEVVEFAAVEPYRVWLRGRAGEPVVAHTVVTSNANHPFEITGVRARKGVWFDLDWTKTPRDGRDAWTITLTNTRQKPGPYQDVLFVQTDHPKRPELKIRVEGRFEAAP